MHQTSEGNGSKKETENSDIKLEHKAEVIAMHISNITELNATVLDEFPMDLFTGNAIKWIAISSIILHFVFQLLQM